MSTVVIRYDGIDITPRVMLSDCSFMSAARGVPGTCQFTVKDLTRSDEFVAGKPLTLTIDGILQWAGFVTSIGRSFFFPVDDPDCEGLVPRGFTIAGVDYNILLNKRYIYDHVTPTTLKLTTYPAGTMDSTIIKAYFAYSDLAADGITPDRVEAVDTPSVDSEISGSASWSFNEFLSYIGRHVGSIWYVDANKHLVYTDVDTPNAPFGISDNPGAGEIGCQRLELTLNGTQLRNDVMIWGAGQGDDQVVFRRLQDTASINTHGRWQESEFNYGVWKQTTVDKIANYYVYGSPQNQRGGKDDAPAVRCRIFEPGLQVADKVNVRLEVHDFEDVLPIRQMTITFASPTDPIWDINLSHEIDDPYSTFDPMPPIHIDIPTIIGPEGPIIHVPRWDKCTLTNWRDEFNRTVSRVQIPAEWGPIWEGTPDAQWVGRSTFSGPDWAGVFDGEAYLRDESLQGSTGSIVLASAVLDADFVRKGWHMVLESRFILRSNPGPDWGGYTGALIDPETDTYEWTVDLEGFWHFAYLLYAGTYSFDIDYDSAWLRQPFPAQRSFTQWGDQRNEHFHWSTPQPSDSFHLNTWYQVKIELDAEARFCRFKVWLDSDDEPNWQVTGPWGSYHYDTDPPGLGYEAPTDLENDPFAFDLYIDYQPRWDINGGYELPWHMSAHHDYIRIFDPLVTLFVDHFRPRELALDPSAISSEAWGTASDGTPWITQIVSSSDEGMGVEEIAGSVPVSPQPNDEGYYLLNVGVMAFGSQDYWANPHRAWIESIPGIYTGDWMFETRFRVVRTGVNDAVADTSIQIDFWMGTEAALLRVVDLRGPNVADFSRLLLDFAGQSESPSIGLFSYNTWYRLKWQGLTTGVMQAKLWKDLPDQDTDNDYWGPSEGQVGECHSTEPEEWTVGISTAGKTLATEAVDQGYDDLLIEAEVRDYLVQAPDSATARLEFSFFRVASPNPCIADLITPGSSTPEPTGGPVGWTCEEDVEARPISRPSGESVLYAYFAVAAPFRASTMELWVDGLFIYPSQLNLNGADEGWIGISDSVDIGGFDPRDPIKTIRMCYYAYEGTG